MTANAIGYVEAITREAVSGWACDPAAPDKRLTVELLVDGWPVATTPASLPRPDLAGMNRGRTDFAFSLRVPQAIAVDIGRIAVRIAGTETLVPFAPDAAMEEGFVELVSPTRVGGWAWHVGHWDERLTLSIELDGTSIATCRADIFRADLLDARVGDGRYGFLLDLPRTLQQAEIDPARLDVVVARSGQQLMDLRAPHRMRDRSAPRVQPAPAEGLRVVTAAPAPSAAPAAVAPAQPVAAPAPAPAAAAPESYFALETPKPRLTNEAVEALRSALYLGEEGGPL